ncbi:MAG TPA: dihydrodipicolinate synthase family protein [Deinococcales bacterium]|nr:dihydrodipicolinate synthase family protein [Deinococcales bacterium]
MLSGIFAPLPTPFMADGRLDLDSLRALAANLASRLDGLLILGSNGETPFLTEAERGLVLRAAREAIPAGKVMLAGVGAETPDATVERCRVAADAGADLALVLPPHYFRAAGTPATLEAHFTRVAAGSPIPLAAYNIPSVTGFAFTAATLASLARAGVISAVKDSSGDINGTYEMLRLAPAGFSVLSGHGQTLLAAVAGGASGGILASANLVPEAYRALLAAAQAGNLAEARRWQHATRPLADAVTARWGVPGLKAALRLQGQPGGYPRLPLADVPEAAQAELKRLLADLNALG